MAPYEAACKRQVEQDNIQAHLQGMYIAEAIESTIGNAFRKKGERYTYPKKPYGIDEVDKNNPEANEILAAEEFKKYAYALREKGIPETVRK